MHMHVILAPFVMMNNFQIATHTVRPFGYSAFDHNLTKHPHINCFGGTHVAGDNGAIWLLRGDSIVHPCQI